MTRGLTDRVRSSGEGLGGTVKKLLCEAGGEAQAAMALVKR